MEIKKRVSMIHSLQSVRIFAALIVLLHHISSIYISKYEIHSFESMFNFGKSGVHLFFVLSGYVMYVAHHKDLGLGFNTGKLFAWKRFTRIYPTYWILTTFVVLAMFLTSGEVKEYKYSLPYIFQSFTLIDFGFMQGNPIIPAAWTLFHEIKFYAFFMLFIIIQSRSIRISLAIIALTMSLTKSALYGTTNSWGIDFYFSEFNFLFAFGVLAAWLTKKHFIFFKSALYPLLSVLGYISVSFLSNYYLWETSTMSILVFGVSGFFIITSFAGYETYTQKVLNRNPFNLNQKMLLFADATYCLYLIHYPVYTIVAMLNKYLMFSDPMLIAIMIGSSIVISIVYYKLIEYPIYYSMKNWQFKKAKVAKPEVLA
ncbi:acyltransferase [Cesiribacter sp. SM1]|uniref:acyltransferase family protein n=1 Tax=Cesiribacter sp. SM1 TaxID=2861196 RepID=UPI001CD40109|nr:acyltransferase [Cesiribacter sp. SM1]